MVCVETGQAQYGRDKTQYTVKLQPVSGYAEGAPEENKRFWEATPVGEFKMGCLKEDIGITFQVGKEYYIDITPA